MTTIIELQKQIIDLTERQKEIDKYLDEKLNERKFNRVNVLTSREKDTHPHITVYSYGFNICCSVYKLWDKSDYKNFNFVSFRETNKKDVIAMTFTAEPTKNSIKITTFDDMRDSTWTVNSVFAVNRLFGGVKFGDRSKFYDACRCNDSKNTVLLYNYTTAAESIQNGITIGKSIQLDPMTRAPKITFVKGRARFNNGFIEALGLEDENAPICVNLSEFMGGGVLSFRRGTPEKGEYVLTPPSKNGGLGMYELCSLEFQKKLGIDVSDPKKSEISFEFLSNSSVLLKVKN